MRFAVTKACGGGGKARAGALYVGGGGGGGAAVVETPSLLLSTRKGLPAFVSRDLLSTLPSPDSHLLHVSPIHFIECPSSKTISNIGGLHQMLGLQEHILVAAASDSVESLPESEASNKLGASFETPSGRRLVKPSEYMQMITSMKPNLWASLADEVPAWVTEKRNRISVDRTLRWLDDCLAVDLEAGKNTLGAVVGGSNIDERKRCATEASLRNVAGFWIGGFGLGESMEERLALLNAVTDCLPEEKLRYVSRLSLPEEVLQGVAAGIDLFDSTYIYHLTLGGFALVFPLDIVERDNWDSRTDIEGADCTKINLRATIYRKDTSPIVDRCGCFTCQNHTRAYINHLLNVHEMLAQILLEIHNTHHYLGFFRLMREAIKGGKFELFRQRFIKRRRAFLTAEAPCSL
ncbi:queuine tRNA-ribosyltransferase accessory subunit 2-like isoform X1 [Ananas comosus]|uniref:Queuine tRNA-ribosyltransferase accessory subunit 2 n=2 Tax=Ananas comosus TaxID=4615 RepID=A0A6P5H113_ANACO|nr:queuine tRNA-ribosyltransferase accessory subunit 2-like isoform X1 [Ananas comosus]